MRKRLLDSYENAPKVERQEDDGGTLVPPCHRTTLSQPRERKLMEINFRAERAKGEQAGRHWQMRSRAEGQPWWHFVLYAAS